MADKKKQAKQQMKDQLFDMVKLASGQINQARLEQIMQKSEQAVESLDKLAGMLVAEKAKILQENTKTGFERVAEDVAQIGTRTVQLTNAVLQLGKEVDALNEKFSQLETLLTSAEGEAV